MRERLLAELDGVKPLSENWVQLPDLNAVCCETLRIVPILMFSFVCILKALFEVMEVSEKLIQAKTICLGICYAKDYQTINS